MKRPRRNPPAAARTRAVPAEAVAAAPEEVPSAVPVMADPPPLARRPLVRAGAYAWSVIGLLAVAYVLGVLLGRLRLLWVPFALALFPAALLAPLNRRLRALRVPAALAALILVLGLLGTIAGAIALLTPLVAAELPGLQESVVEGYAQIQAFLETGPFGLDPASIPRLIEQARQQLVESDVVRTGVLGAAGAAAEIVAMTVLLLVVLFFFLKDGDRVAVWVRDLFPERARADVQVIGLRAWNTVGAYFRGQLFVALVDAIGIGIGLWLLGVPLVLPLAVLVFFGGLFPIVGAVLTGIIAVLVALADGGLLIALAVLGVVLAVQQLESNVLAPLVLGKAVELHPLAVLTALTAGGILLGVLGAFIAVPVAASLARAVGHLRRRVPG
jgi:putative heme transporter